MADSTINYGFPYPQGADRVAVHTDVENLAKSVDAAALQTNLRVDSAIPYRGNLDEQTGTLATLDAGRYAVRYTGTAAAWGLPHALIGDLTVIHTGNQKQIVFEPNDSSPRWGANPEYTLSTDSGGTLRDRWQRVDRSIMRTAPVVLTGPAGEYPQTNSRGSVRLPFTVPTGVSKVRVHMRPWNFRTRKEWGPAQMRGVMIAEQSSGGAITGSRWYAPNVDGQIVSGSEEWVSDWFYVGLTPGSTYLLSYGVEWQDGQRDLMMGACWSSFELDDWDTDGPVNYQAGWGKFGLQPMDIWIECEAPSSVPVWGYYGSSNTVGVSSGDAVFGAYANVHARKNGAFAAITAAGGWSLMDETMHDSAIINRLGYPARMLDRVYLDLGANIEARDATAAEAITEMERWMNSKLNSLGNPPVHLLTQISRYTNEETTDTSGTLSDWNEWIRYEATQRPEVVGLIDQAAIFADPEKPWTARVELRASPTDVHFSAMGQKLRAAALDGEVHLPMLTQKNADDVPWRVGFQWTGEPNDSQSVMKVGDREAARNLYLDPALTDPSTWSTADTVTSIELGPTWTGNANSTGFSLSGEAGSIHAGAAASHRIPVSPGDVVTMGVNLATSEGFSLQARIYWYDSSSNFITAEDAPNHPSSGEKVFTRVVVTGTAPESAASAYPHFWLYEGDVNPTVPATGYIDGITLERGETDGAYFDGDTAGWDRMGRLESVQEQELQLMDDWRTDVGSEVVAYRTGNVVTVSAWRLAVNSGVPGEVIAYSLPTGYQMPPLTNIYGIETSRGGTVNVIGSSVRILNPSTLVSHHSFTFVTLDDPII